MRSAIYYPRSEVRSPLIMQSALLMWDELRTIIPYKGYGHPDSLPRDLAEAWELIGR